MWMWGDVLARFVWRFLKMLLQFGVKKVRTQIKNTRKAVGIENKALFNTSWVTKVQIPKNTKENTKAKNKTTTRRSKKYNSGIKTRNMTRGNTAGHRWAQVKGGKTNDGRNWNATLDTRRHNFKIRQNHKLNQDKWLKSSAINLFFNKHKFVVILWNSELWWYVWSSGNYDKICACL